MESVVVYSGKDIRTMKRDGGSGHWTARAARVENAEYLVCVRNRREQLAATDVEHGTAFLIARIDKTKPSVHAGRIVIVFDSCAAIRVPDAWRLLTDGQRFPVAYERTSEILKKLRIDVNKLDWQPLHGTPGPVAAAQPPALHVAEPVAPYGAAPAARHAFADAHAEAKKILAESLGLSTDRIDIEITIRP